MHEDQDGSEDRPDRDQWPPEYAGPHVPASDGGTSGTGADHTAAFGEPASGDTVSFGPSGEPYGAAQPMRMDPQGEGGGDQPAGFGSLPAGSYGQPGGYGQGGYGQQPGGAGGYGQPGYGAGGPGGYGTPPPPPGGYGAWGSPPGGYGEPPRRRGRGRFLALVAVAVLAAGAGAGAAVALNNSGNGNSTGVSSHDIPLPGSNSGGSTTSGLNVQSVANKVEPGVVDITSTLQYSSETAEGTGMVLNSDGLVLTNNHVIDGATAVKATLVGTGKTYTARVVGYDATDDVALLQLQGASGLKTVSVGNSDQATLGTQVLAIGNAQGQGGTPTVAPGIINSTNRTITASDQGSGNTETLHGMLQTSAQIQPGDSGGPLVNAGGKVVGMDTAASTGASGSSSATTTMGYAIPINRALSIARQIAAGHGSSTIQIGLPGFLGVLVPQSNSASPQQQAQQEQQQGAGSGAGGGFGGFGGQSGGTGGTGGSSSCVTSATNTSVPSTIAPASTGALIDNVLCNSAAATAGLAGGDVITAVNGQAVTTPGSLTTIMSKYHGGDKVKVSYTDTSGGKHTTPLTLGTSPAK